MSHEPAFDASIPILTEVLKMEPGQPAPAFPGAGHGDAAPPRLPDAATPRGAPSARTEEQAMAGWSEPEWAALERRLSERILGQVRSSVDVALEQRIRDSLAEALEHALRGLGGELRAGLHETMGEIVARAVTEELAELRARGAVAR